MDAFAIHDPGTLEAANPHDSLQVEASAASENAAREVLGRLLARFQASGIALGVRDGASLVCAATAGVGVPPLGTRLNGRGVCADAFEQKIAIVCPDTAHDSRVDKN